MKNSKYLLIGLISTISFFSCDGVLDEIPDNRTQIDTPGKIGELLTGAYVEAGYPPFLEPRTDNAIDKGPSASEYRLNTEMYFWRDVFDDDDDYPTNYWNACYKAIAQANQALASIEELGDGPELSKYKGEAFLCRAYAHFMLANIWAKSYNPTTAAKDLGVPYLTKPETVLIKQYERGTLEFTYENIERDLLEGIQYVTNDYEVPTFHFNQSAAYSFATRFYLFKGEWDKVIQYANRALNTNGEPQLRDWAGVYSTLNFNQIVNRYIAGNTVEPTNNLLVTAASLFARRDYDARYQLGNDLNLQLFSGNNPAGSDWAYQVYNRGGDLTRFIPKYTEYFRITNASAGIGFPFTTYVLFSNDEVILSRAEAYAMTGQYDLAVNDFNYYLTFKVLDYDPAIDTLTKEDIDDYYAIANDFYTPFYTIPNEALSLVNGLMELKRREFYNEGLRWFDIRRFDLKITHFDENEAQLVLDKGDNRKVLQIPNEAVSFGIEANPR